MNRMGSFVSNASHQRLLDRIAEKIVRQTLRKSRFSLDVNLKIGIGGLCSSGSARTFVKLWQSSHTEYFRGKNMFSKRSRFCRHRHAIMTCFTNNVLR